MALFLPGNLVSDIRGKLGGSVFQRSAAGLTIRNKTSAVNRKTLTQTVTRGIIAYVQAAWQNLTDQERNVWNTYQGFQAVKQKNIIGNKINGHQLFLMVNTKFVQYGQSILTVPIFTKSPLRSIGFFIDLQPPNLVLNTDRIIDPDVEFIYLTMSPPMSPSVMSFIQKKSLIRLVSVASQTFFIDNLYVGLFGKIPVNGERLYWRASLISKSNGLEYSAREQTQTTY